MGEDQAVEDRAGEGAATSRAAGRTPEGGGASRPQVRHLLRRHRKLLLVVVELVAVAGGIGVLGGKAPGLAASIGHYVGQLRRPSPLTLTVALGVEVVALAALAAMPRELLKAHGLRLRRSDAFAIGVAANGLSVVLPGGSVPSGVWLAHQLNRRGARGPLAAWAVLADGFASSVVLAELLVIGAGVDGLVPPWLTIALVAFVIGGAAGFLALVHRVDRLEAWAEGREGDHLVARLAIRFAELAAEAAQFRAGWRPGARVVVLAAINWLADAACLVAVFDLVRAPVPWRVVLLAFAAGQLFGALIPLPAALGAVEGGLAGIFIAAGSAAGPVLVVVAIYRLVGYWLPAFAALPAYSWARRRPDATAGDGTQSPAGDDDPRPDDPLPDATLPDATWPVDLRSSAGGDRDRDRDRAPAPAGPAAAPGTPDDGRITTAELEILRGLGPVGVCRR